tara:strand:+ start:1474 stop:2451 length:978 start_codon:yes stop_codon:yes gene_type:complete
MKHYMKTKFAIGCLVQWYEVDIIGEYIETLNEAIEQYDGEVIVDFTLCLNQDLEKCISEEQLNICEYTIDTKLEISNFKTITTTELVTIADYRREFNDKYCESVDVLMWGESDALIPKQTFNVLDNLHQMSLQNDNPKYLAFFGTCKMWDKSWEILEHPDFTNKPFIDGDTNNWWSLRYDMSKDEMNKINEKTEDLEVSIAPQHKFNGCGLVISSEVIKSGVNIPKSVFFVHEDSAFMYMTNKILGNIPQYIIKNILLVHNRKHKNKRRYIKGEEHIADKEIGGGRLTHPWYMIANQMCEQNYHNLFNPNYKSFKWGDVWNSLKK